MEDKTIQEIDLDNPEFQSAWQLISHTRQSVFLTGKAGTGKSTFLRHICGNTKKRHVILAPTGIAAVNAGGVTLHSFFKLPFKPLLPDDPDFATPRRMRERMKYSRTFIKLLNEIELIVIDEISMVRADIIDFIDRLLRIYCHNSRDPFAGKQLLLVGDVFQLEPVVTSDTREILRRHYPNPFFFSANAFKISQIVPIELKKVYRQADQQFISILDRIRTGVPTDDDIRTLNARVATDSAQSGTNAGNMPMSMTLATRRDMVDHINEQHLMLLRTAEHTYRGVQRGDFPESSLPTPMELILKADAQVVFIKNDPERRWVNGTLGKIKECGDDSVEVELEDGTCHTVTPELWSNIKYEYDEHSNRITEKEIGSYVQLPLRLAWALTIHKSQGLTFNSVIIDLGHGAFTSGQTYVALSRCRSLQGMTLRATVNGRDMMVNPAVLHFSRNYNNPALINAAMEAARADRCYGNALELWRKGEFDSAFDSFVEGLKARPELNNATAMRLARRQLAVATVQRQEIARLSEIIENQRRQLESLASEYVAMGEDCREEAFDINAALANFDKAISLAPGYTTAWLAKGLALAEMMDTDAAIDCFNRAHQLEPQSHRPLLEAGRLYLATGDIHNAFDRLLAALQLNKTNAAIHSALADAYEAIDSHEDAEKHRKLAARYSRRKKK